MKPETAGFLAAADQDLSDARGNLSIGIHRQAARLAYYAQIHAAQALIFERIGKISKTDRGVDRQFHKLAQGEPTLPPRLSAQLSKAYNYKEIGDYDTGTAQPITAARAQDALATAERFVGAIRQALATPWRPIQMRNQLIG